jgi:hypothetical protein
VTDAAPDRTWLGIDFSGNHKMWSAGCRRSNVWIAEIQRSGGTNNYFVLCDLKRVQQLPGEDHPFSRLGRYLAQRKFAAAGIDAPFSVPARFMPPGGHQSLLAEVTSLEHAGRPFAKGKVLVNFLTQGCSLDTKKPLRLTEQEWSDRRVNIRSTLWAEPRGGAPMTAACIKLLGVTGCPLWPWMSGGPGLLVEAFPAGQLKYWHLPSEQYSKDVDTHFANREKIVVGLESRLDLQGWHDTLRSSADAIDAVVCALTAAGVTHGILGAAPDKNVAVHEGWIAISE